MGIATSADGIRQTEAVEPTMDDAVAGAQRDATAVGNETGQGAVRLHIDEFRIRRSVAEGLHHHVGREAETGQIFQFVAGHRPGGVLRADRRHLRFAVGIRAHALAFWQSTGAPNHLLGQRVAFASVDRISQQTEQRRGRETQRFTRLGRQTTTDDQRNTSTSAHFIEDHRRFEFSFGNHGTVFECGDLIRRSIDA